MFQIQTRDLGLERDGKTILENIDLSIEPGEFFGIIGPTGAGKSSLLRLLDLLERPTTGGIMINGKSAETPERERLALRRSMAFVQQKPVVFDMSVSGNVAMGLRWRSKPREEAKRRAAGMLEMVGLGGRGEQNARTLSGGEMQRVAIARALVVEPEALFLDEPTANLDPVSTAAIERVLARIGREARMTVIMATHDMSQGQKLAGRIGVIMSGRMVQVGTPRDIFTRPDSRALAEFVGVDNIWSGVVAGRQDELIDVRVNSHVLQAVADFEPGQPVDLLIRPEDITISRGHEASSARNVFAGTVSDVSVVGALARVEIDCGFPVMALVTRKSVEEMSLTPGDTVTVSFKATAVKVNRNLEG